ncbi:MAG: FUSC family protein [Sphingomonadaceae bacterium]
MTPDTAAPPPPQVQSAATAGVRWLLQQTRCWAGSEGQRWTFVAKAMLAAFSALWLAFRLGLDSPNTAMTTTFILALPSSGMVLEKAFYRLLGTLVGCSAALLIVALFPQQPPLLFLALAAWVGLCTAGAALYRNQQSYSFVLSGYTACMIAIPAIDLPTGAFTLAVTRLTEVGLGIIVAAVVHDVLFPRHAGQQVMSTVQARYTRFIGFCGEVLERRLSPTQVELNHLRFAADIATLESGRAAAFFEAAHARSHTRQLHAFNNAFMAALTTFYTLHRLTHRLRQQPASDPASARVLALVEPLHALLAAALQQELSAVAPDWLQVQQQLALSIAATRAGLGAVERAPRIDFDTAIELLQRFARDMADFAALYHGLAQQKRMQVSDPVAYHPRTPVMIVAGSGLRAALALLAGATLWYWLAWPYLGTAIVMTSIFSALASSSPRPTAMIKGVMLGFLLGAPLSFLTEFLLVVQADAYPMLVLAALPLFALGCYLSTDPQRAAMGIGMTLFCAQLVAPLNQMHYDGAAFLSAILAQIGGVALAYLIFAVILPEHTMGQKDHVADALWREALAVCRGPLLRLKHRFDNRVRDLLAQLSAAAGPAPDAGARAVVRQGLTLLELGHSVIELRQLIDSSPAGPVRNGLQLCVYQLSVYFRAPTPASNAAVRYVVLQAGATIRAELADTDPARHQRLHTALTDLHSIYTSLLDQQPQPGVADHAT